MDTKFGQFGLLVGLMFEVVYYIIKDFFGLMYHLGRYLLRWVRYFSRKGMQTAVYSLFFYAYLLGVAALDPGQDVALAWKEPFVLQFSAIAGAFFGMGFAIFPLTWENTSGWATSSDEEKTLKARAERLDKQWFQWW